MRSFASDGETVFGEITVGWVSSSCMMVVQPRTVIRGRAIDLNSSGRYAWRWIAIASAMSILSRTRMRKMSRLGNRRTKLPVRMGRWNRAEAGRTHERERRPPCDPSSERTELWMIRK